MAPKSKAPREHGPRSAHRCRLAACERDSAPGENASGANDERIEPWRHSFFMSADSRQTKRGPRLTGRCGNLQIPSQRNIRDALHAGGLCRCGGVLSGLRRTRAETPPFATTQQERPAPRDTPVSSPEVHVGMRRNTPMGRKCHVATLKRSSDFGHLSPGPISANRPRRRTPQSDNQNDRTPSLCR
jgi:hypothetical protein